jgi:thymidylate synthase (FAD)
MLTVDTSILTKPQLIYEEVGDKIGMVEYVRHMGDDKSIVDAARVSFAGDSSQWRPKEDPKLIRYLMKNKHWSPFEHCVVTWHVKVPLFVRSQWHRHRTASYNEVSRRYTSEDIEFYLPNNYRRQSKSNKQASKWTGPFDPELILKIRRMFASAAVKAHTKASIMLYETMLEHGIAREQARMILPQNMYTRFYVTCNLRNALHFVSLREDSHSQWEIYKPAEVMRKQLELIFPESMSSWREIGNRITL